MAELKTFDAKQMGPVTLIHPREQEIVGRNLINDLADDWSNTSKKPSPVTSSSRSKCHPLLFRSDRRPDPPRARASGPREGRVKLCMNKELRELFRVTRLDGTLFEIYRVRIRRRGLVLRKREGSLPLVAAASPTPGRPSGGISLTLFDCSVLFGILPTSGPLRNVASHVASLESSDMTKPIEVLLGNLTRREFRERHAFRAVAGLHHSCGRHRATSRTFGDGARLAQRQPRRHGRRRTPKAPRPGRAGLDVRRQRTPHEASRHAQPAAGHVSGRGQRHDRKHVAGRISPHPGPQRPRR